MHAFLVMLVMLVCQRPHPEVEIEVLSSDEFLHRQEEPDEE